MTWETLRMEPLLANFNMSCILEMTEVLQYHTFICKVGTELLRSVSSYFYLYLFFAYVGTTAGTVNNKSERCRSLGFFFFFP